MYDISVFQNNHFFGHFKEMFQFVFLFLLMIKIGGYSGSREKLVIKCGFFLNVKDEDNN